jgi:hypothetical protein
MMSSRQQAVQLLGNVGTRLAHSESVANQAAVAVCLLDEPWRSVLVDAAWLHDIGYAPTVRRTGFHPLDGARWLREQAWPPEVYQLVAWHTHAETEARLMGLADDLVAEFIPPPVTARAVLTWADLTSSPTGQVCAPADRLAEVLQRYEAGTTPYEAIVENFGSLLADATWVQHQLDLKSATVQ